MDGRIEFKNPKPIIPALLTPFDSEGEVNAVALRELIEKCIGEGIDGIFACGSTAEVFLLTKKERRRTMEAIIDCVDERIPVIAHIGSPSPMEAIKLAKHARKQGASAVSAVPPFYHPYSDQEIIDFYFRLADEAEAPVVLYNIPMFTHVELSVERFRPLYEDERILGLKFTHTDLIELSRIKRYFPEKWLFMGLEESLLGALSMGADGSIGSTFNDIAPLGIKLRNAYLNEDMDLALDMQRRINRYCDALKVAGGPRGIKYALSLKGYDVGGCRLPYQPITDAGMRAMDAASAETL